MILFPGETDAIATAVHLGAIYGYGNLIYHLKDAWSAELQVKYGFDKPAADRAALHICPWCQVDSRTGQVAKDTP
jgi:hypothetical protein